MHPNKKSTYLLWEKLAAPMIDLFVIAINKKLGQGKN